MRGKRAFRIILPNHHNGVEKEGNLHRATVQTKKKGKSSAGTFDKMDNRANSPNFGEAIH